MTAQTVTVTEKRVLSSDGIHTLAGKVYLPGGEVKGLLQVVHGMSEHIGRYDEFMRRLAAEGYIVFGHDHLGHGKTANENELGYIAKKDGWLRLAEDVSVFKNGAVNGLSELPDIGSLPYFLMGHSMGSFVVRTASELYLKPDKLIIMGTGGPNPASGAGLALAKIIKLFCGEKHISNLLYFLMFGSYNRKFKENDIVSWLSTDKSERDKNRADKFCTFKFTVSALEDLIKLQSFANRKDWFKNISSDIKILLVSGSLDPVGNYSKGVDEVYNRLKSNGKDVKKILYQGYRHEILNDFCRDYVIRDIIDFLSEPRK